VRADADEFLAVGNSTQGINSLDTKIGFQHRDFEKSVTWITAEIDMFQADVCGCGFDAVVVVPPYDT
jgi:tRNA1(Val) A37 N6-methylase TrmN6